MSVPFSNVKIRAPNGFQNLLEAYITEVLRQQPENLYEFGAVFFEEMIAERQRTGIDDVAKLGNRIQDRFYNMRFKRASDDNDQERDDAALKIQTEYRRHEAAVTVDHMRQEEAGEIIHAAVEGHHDRAHHEETSDEAEAALMSDSQQPQFDAEAEQSANDDTGIEANLFGQDEESQWPAELAANSQSELVADLQTYLPDESQADFQIDLAAELTSDVQAESQEGDAQLASDRLANVDPQPLQEEQNEPLAGQQDLEQSVPVEKQRQKIELPEEVRAAFGDDVDPEEMTKAALKIQAGFKGLKIRRQVREQLAEKSPDDQAQEPDESEAHAAPEDSVQADFVVDSGVVDGENLRSAEEEDMQGEVAPEEQDTGRSMAAEETEGGTHRQGEEETTAREEPEAAEHPVHSEETGGQIYQDDAGEADTAVDPQQEATARSEQPADEHHAEAAAESGDAPEPETARSEQPAELESAVEVDPHAPEDDGIEPHAQQAPSGEAHADGGEAQADAAEAQADGGEAQADAADSGEAQADAAEAQPDGGEAQADAAEAQPDGGEAQADAAEAQADGGEAQADAAEAQADGGEAHADGGEAQADAAEAQADGGEAQADGGEAQADGGEAQADGGEAQADGGDAQAGAESARDDGQPNEGEPAEDQPTAGDQQGDEEE